ncbi:MAG TPA: 8-amino-7-oxononanoate synthase [Lysobacter sp.]|nr:8-amino-7-oxononanoate synthase [Lysobacter sp.]
MTAQRPDLRQRVADARARRLAAHAVRLRRTVERRQGVRVQVDGQWLVGFNGNDYLGLAQHPLAQQSAQEAMQRYGLGGTASHLVSGHTLVHDQLERELANWLGYPRGLLFGSGFMANLAVVQSLLGEGDVCVQDKLNHASLIDAARLAGCRLRRYPHADAEGALRQLRASPDGAALLITDGVFSMDGDIAPLKPLALAARIQRALFYVDDAHGIGVIGPDGRGSVAHAGWSAEQVPLLLVTLGKALGGYGAVLLGEEALIQHLQETARPYLYTTALPPALAAASLGALRVAQRQPNLRQRVHELVERFRTRAQRRGLPLMESETPIQPVLLGDNARTLAVARAVFEAGYWVSPIRPPTVPEGQARIRVTLSASHTDPQVDGLVDALARACEQHASPQHA